MIRLFIGLPIHSNVKSLLKPTFDYLTGHEKILKVVSLENYHITMKFLGECNERDSREIKSVFDDIPVNKKKIPYDIFGIGAFPSIRRARVIWYGIRTDFEEISNMYKIVENSYSRFGKREENKFIPHLTIARVRRKESLKGEMIEFIEKNKDSLFVESYFDKLVLFSSQLTPNGPIYNELKSIALE